MKTKAEIAKEYGTTYRAVRYFLTGKTTNPKLALLKAVSKIYGYSFIIQDGEYKIIKP